MLTNANIYELGMMDAYQKRNRQIGKSTILGSIMEKIKQRRNMVCSLLETSERGNTNEL